MTESMPARRDRDADTNAARAVDAAPAASGDAAAANAAASAQDRRRSMAAEVKALLSRPQKELSPKWFYDARGSALFDEITRLPEYYLTRTERALLEQQASHWLATTGARALVELGPGSGEKAAILLQALPNDVTYVPVDISATYLDAVTAELHASMPHVRVRPVMADITKVVLPRDLSEPAVIAFLGSTIGNFDALGAQRLLRRVRDVLRSSDRLLLGADLRKDAATLEAAYNDAQGVTAAFNLNILHVLNRELGADFDPAAFEHVAAYDADTGRIEMRLHALRAMRVHIPDAGTFEFDEGETIRTEISTKYDRATLESLLDAAGLVLEHWFTDDQARFALLVARRTA